MCSTILVISNSRKCKRIYGDSRSVIAQRKRGQRRGKKKKMQRLDKSRQLSMCGPVGLAALSCCAESQPVSKSFQTVLSWSDCQRIQAGFVDGRNERTPPPLRLSLGNLFQLPALGPFWMMDGLSSMWAGRWVAVLSAAVSLRQQTLVFYHCV